MLATVAGLNHDTSKLDGLKVMPPEVQAKNNRDLAVQEPLDNNLRQLPFNLSLSEEKRFIVMPESTYERQNKRKRTTLMLRFSKKEKRKRSSRLTSQNPRQRRSV
jgi:hypothetical protein